MRATHLLALTLVKHAAPVPTPDMYAAGMYMNPLITGGGGAAIGALINALRGKGVGRGAMTGLATGLGTSIGALGGTLGGAAVGSGGNPGLYNQHEMVNGMRVGAPVGALAGGGLGYALSHRSDEDEEREEREKKHKQPEPKTAAVADEWSWNNPIVRGGATGAGAGALLGAGAGALLGEKKKKWKAALLGALSGGGIGLIAGGTIGKNDPELIPALGAKKAAALGSDTPAGYEPPQDFANQLFKAQNPPKSATTPVAKPKLQPIQGAGKKTAQDAAPATPFYKDPANIGALAGAALAGGGAALLSKKNKWRNALIAALAGGTAGYFAGPHVDKAVPQIREGFGKVGDMISPPAKTAPPPVKPVAAETPPPVTPHAPQSATAPGTDLSALGTLAPPKFDV